MRYGLATAALCLAPLPAWAHGGQPASAPIVAPANVPTIVDTEVQVYWTDQDTPPPLGGTSTVDLYITDARPPTFIRNNIPYALTGELVVQGVPEEDLANTAFIDTSTLPAGNYWVWSFVNEPAAELSENYYHFSPAPFTVAHPGDDVHPSVRVLTPNSPTVLAPPTYEIVYDAFDPDGSAWVTLEATQEYDGTHLVTIADGLPAVRGGTFRWDTTPLASGDWTIRATITDCRGYQSSTYATYYLFVNNAFGPDAGPADVGTRPTLTDAAGICTEDRDAGPRDFGIEPDGGEAPPDAGSEPIDAGARRPHGGLSEPPDDGCRGVGGRGAAPLALLLGLLAARRRR